MAQTNPQVTVESIRERMSSSFPAALGIEPLEITNDGARARIVVDERHLHPGGLVHGGVWVALADTVAAWPTLRNMPPGYDFTTVELKMNLYASAGPGDELTGIAEKRHVGRRTQVWEVSVHNGDRLAATFICTQMVLPPK